MYLIMLNEEQKQLFLGFAYHLVYRDGVYSDLERQMMDSYCQEMNIPFNMSKAQLDEKTLINEMTSSCDATAKRIFLFEAIGLAMSDSHYDSSERKFILSVSKAFGFGETYIQHCENLLSDYMNLQNKMNLLILDQEA